MGVGLWRDILVGSFVLSLILCSINKMQSASVGGVLSLSSRQECGRWLWPSPPLFHTGVHAYVYLSNVHLHLRVRACVLQSNPILSDPIQSNPIVQCTSHHGGYDGAVCGSMAVTASPRNSAQHHQRCCIPTSVPADPHPRCPATLHPPASTRRRASPLHPYTTHAHPRAPMHVSPR